MEELAEDDHPLLLEGFRTRGTPIWLPRQKIWACHWWQQGAVKKNWWGLKSYSGDVLVLEDSGCVFFLHLIGLWNGLCKSYMTGVHFHGYCYPFINGFQMTGLRSRMVNKRILDTDVWDNAFVTEIYFSAIYIRLRLKHKIITCMNLWTKMN